MKLLFSFLLILATSFPGQSQTAVVVQSSKNLKFTYKLTYRIDSTSTATQTEIMNLFTGQGISKFECQWVQQRDSLAAANAGIPDTQESIQAYVNQLAAMPKTDFKYTIYKLAASGKTYYYDRVGSIFYCCEQPLNTYTWTIAKETNKIAGFACQRATTAFAGRAWEAWFTREIAVSDGPYKFSGLPGLIVEVNDTRQHYVFELVKLTKLKTPVALALPTRKTVATTMAQLRQGSIDYALAVSSRQAAKGATVSAARAQEVRERVKRNNNPLELK